MKFMGTSLEEDNTLGFDDEMDEWLTEEDERQLWNWAHALRRDPEVDVLVQQIMPFRRRFVYLDSYQREVAKKSEGLIHREYPLATEWPMNCLYGLQYRIHQVLALRIEECPFCEKDTL